MYLKKHPHIGQGRQPLKTGGSTGPKLQRGGKGVRRNKLRDG